MGAKRPKSRVYYISIYRILDEGPSVACGVFKIEFERKKIIQEKNFIFEKKQFLKKIKFYFFKPAIPRAPMGALKNVSPFGPAVWPAIGKIYTNVLFLYKEKDIQKIHKVIILYSLMERTLLLVSTVFQEPDSPSRSLISVDISKRGRFGKFHSLSPLYKSAIHL